MRSAYSLHEIVDVCAAKFDETAFRESDWDEARRLFHGRGHCYPGLEHIVVTWFAPYLLVGVYADAQERPLQTMIDELLALNARSIGPHIAGVGVQIRQGRKTRTEEWRGNLPDTHLVREHGLSYWVELKRNQNVGLFLDAGHMRRHMRPHMQDANVLNLFAYTCAFSVSAISQGASQVVNNDMSKNALSWGRKNHVANEQDLRRVRMLPHNLFKSWWKIRQFAPYDVVIIDPPTNQKGSFVAEKNYGQVLKRLPDLTRAGGRVFACLNSPFLGAEFLTNQMARWAPQCRLVRQLPQHPDFPDRFAERALKILEFECL